MLMFVKYNIDTDASDAFRCQCSDVNTGPDSGYRSYHMQVEAYLDWDRREKDYNAAKPKFKGAYVNGAKNITNKKAKYYMLYCIWTYIFGITRKYDSLDT